MLVRKTCAARSQSQHVRSRVAAAAAVGRLAPAIVFAMLGARTGKGGGGHLCAFFYNTQPKSTAVAAVDSRGARERHLRFARAKQKVTANSGDSIRQTRQQRRRLASAANERSQSFCDLCLEFTLSRRLSFTSSSVRAYTINDCCISKLRSRHAIK